MDDPPACLIYPHEVLDGLHNMARDEALLESVAADGTHAAFRTYEWSEPTLSLGYFQSIREVESDSSMEGVAVVRRPSGGGAILHEHDLTFALVVPVVHPLAKRSGPLYQSIHAAVSQVLQGRGLPVQRRPEGEAASDSRARPFLCFEDKDPEDLLLGGWKVVGSAQRRRSGAVLQHGSILLERSGRAPQLPGIADLAPRSFDPATWAEALRTEVPNSLGFRAVEREWPSALLERSATLAREVYGDPRWARRR